MSEKLDRFVKLLKEIFELDKADLDFGIYRVLNLRKAQIEQFLAYRLPEMVKETLTPFAQSTNDLATLEIDVYSALYAFFNRYYEDGDFISKRRYKEGVYAIPYEGEEVKLYWANQDQYYIKTGENFKDYTFVFDGISVHFRLVDATTEQNNNKESKDGKRTFMLFTEDAEKYPSIKTFEYNPNAAELVIRFVYDIPKDKKRKYAEENYAAIVTWLVSLHKAELNPLIMCTGKDNATLLEKHLKRYVAKNTFDYFIHKDLRKFLARELDFFIKSEVMHLEDLDTDNEARVETYLAQVKVIKRVGKIIIEFLAQIEDFQKKLWLKKKFIVATDWCITLDKVDESFWAEIIANKAQLNEWITLYAIDEAEGWTNPPTIDFLRRNKNLIIDTKHFPDAFKYALLETIPNLDEQTNGLMINGDNFHALNLLQSNYREQIKCVYIDPPYNTNAAPILYKDGYKDSSWLCLMEKRLHLSKVLSSDDGAIFISIDDNEQANLKLLCDEIFGANNFFATLTRRSMHTVRNSSKDFNKNSDFILAYTRNKDRLTADKNYLIREKADKSSDYKFNDNDGRGFYKLDPIYARNYAKPYTFIFKNGVVWSAPEGSYPRYSQETLTEMEQTNRLDFNGKFPRAKRYLNEVQDGQPPDTLLKPETVGFNSDGTKTLAQVLGIDKAFNQPKPIQLVEYLISILPSNENSIVLDYFAGSGTTGHAVINLNREDGGDRKYILVEMGEYFDTVTKPRMQKVIYCADWKDGKPQNRNSGVSQIIKYMRLESYEDALSNIELSDKGRQWASLFGEDYIIRYMLTMESRDNLLNMENFSNPFAYSMKITEKNECKSRPVDLTETFNYLIGLKVARQSAIAYYLSKPATNPAYEGALELVNDINGEYAFRQIEGTLPDGRRALIIWRIVTKDIIASNAALDAYFIANAGNHKHDVIFVNGDSNLENLRGSHENWTVKMTELEFKKLMFEEP